MYSHDDIALRTVQNSDANIILEWENTISNWSVSGTDREYSLSEIVHLMEALEDFEQAKQSRFMIIERSTNLPIGAADIFDCDFNEEQASIGVLIADQEKRQKNAAKIALTKLMEHCNDHLGIKKITATVHETNHASIRLFESLGFEKIGFSDNDDIRKADYIKTLIFKKWLEK